MATTEQDRSPSPTLLSEEVSRLDTPDLDTFLDKALMLRAERRAPHLSREETDLLLKINTPLPTETWKRYSSLQAGRKADKVTEVEHAELLRLIDVVETDNAERIGRVAELARLRGTTLEALMRSLGVGPRPHA